MGWVCGWDPSNSWLKPSFVPVKLDRNLNIQLTSLHSQMAQFVIKSAKIYFVQSYK